MTDKPEDDVGKVPPVFSSPEAADFQTFARRLGDGVLFPGAADAQFSEGFKRGVEASPIPNTLEYKRRQQTERQRSAESLTRILEAVNATKSQPTDARKPKKKTKRSMAAWEIRTYALLGLAIAIVGAYFTWLALAG